MAKEALCASCSNSIFCRSWGQYKCTEMKVSFSVYGRPLPTKCSNYVKRPKNFTEMKCGCKTCQVNEGLYDLDEEQEG